MIKKFIARVFGGKKSARGSAKIGEPRIHSQREHGIARESISNAALRVCDGRAASTREASRMPRALP